MSPVAVVSFSRLTHLFLFYLFFSPTYVPDSLHFLSASLHFPLSLLSPPLSCSLLLFVPAASVAFSTFLSWRGEVGLWVGGRLLECGRGGKGPVKQREVVCWQGRQETQISQDSPPVAAPWLSCWPTPDRGWQPLWAPALCYLSILSLFLVLGFIFYFVLFSYFSTSIDIRTSTITKWFICS